MYNSLSRHYEACIPDVAEVSRIYILHSIYTQKHVCLQVQVYKLPRGGILLDYDRITFLFRDSCGLPVGYVWVNIFTYSFFARLVKMNFIFPLKYGPAYL